MSRWYAAFGVVGAGLCGYLIADTTLRPELENQRLERIGETPVKTNPGDKVISEAITSDLKEAKAQVTDTSGGFAWGIRQAIFGKPEQNSPTDADTVKKDSTPGQSNGDK